MNEEMIPDYGNGSIGDDMRRDDDDFKRSRNGGPNYDRFVDYLADRDRGGMVNINSGEPMFLLDHLATFSAGSRNGPLHAEDGLRKLRQMENTTGIWTMRCVLVVERGFLVIVDNGNGEELERFPIQNVTDPTAIFKNDHREHYNSLILFTIVDDPKKKLTQADMHIFQTCGGAPPQAIVDEILAAKGGQPKLGGAGGSSLMVYQTMSSTTSSPYTLYNRGNIPPPPQGPAPEPPNGAYNFQGMRDYLDTQGHSQFGAPSRVPQNPMLARVSNIREKEDIDGGTTEIMERDVTLLNHCFDDIEKFVARLQQAAEAFKELERRKRERGAKNKKRQSGDGMLNARARPPMDKDFIDIFQKFKLAFNLLAKLKAHIHDPNAPELVHFLFTPLSLIYEASRDPYHGNQNLGDQAVAPVLTADAKLLLQNCLTSKELELWHALGKHWTTSRADWQGHIPPYVPQFYDGWQPAGSVVDDMASRTAPHHQTPLVLPVSEPLRQPSLNDRSGHYHGAPPRPTPFPDDDIPPAPSIDRYNGNPYNNGHASNFGNSISHQNGDLDRPSNDYGRPSNDFGRSSNDFGRSSNDYGRSSNDYGRSNNDYGRSNDFGRSSNDYGRPPTDLGRSTANEQGRSQKFPLMSRQDENAQYMDDLMRMDDALIYEAAHDRMGKNSKELNVQKGDVLHVLDNTKNWWKMRNSKGEVGFAPYTILKAIRSEDDLERNGPLSSSRSGFDTKASSRRGDMEADYDDLSTIGYGESQSRRASIDSADRYNREMTNRTVANTTVGSISYHHEPEPYYSQQTTNAQYAYPNARPQRQRPPSPTSRIPKLQPQTDRLPTLPAPSPAPRTVMKTAPFSSIRGNGEAEASQGVADLDLDSLPLDLGMFKPIEAIQSRPIALHADSLQQEHGFTRSNQQQRSFKSSSPGQVVKLSHESTAKDVSAWLRYKGFRPSTCDMLAGYNGMELFALQPQDARDFLPHEDSVRLDGLLRLQKNACGYGTMSAKELNAILERRKEHVNNAVFKMNAEEHVTDFRSNAQESHNTNVYHQHEKQQQQQEYDQQQQKNQHNQYYQQAQPDHQAFQIQHKLNRQEQQHQRELFDIIGRRQQEQHLQQQRQQEQHLQQQRQQEQHLQQQRQQEQHLQQQRQQEQHLQQQRQQEQHLQQQLQQEQHLQQQRQQEQHLQQRQHEQQQHLQNQRKQHEQFQQMHQQQQSLQQQQRRQHQSQPDSSTQYRRFTEKPPPPVKQNSFADMLVQQKGRLRQSQIDFY